jgi:hypothetical protein
VIKAKVNGKRAKIYAKPSFILHRPCQNSVLLKYMRRHANRYLAVDNNPQLSYRNVDLLQRYQDFKSNLKWRNKVRLVATWKYDFECTPASEPFSSSALPYRLKHLHLQSSISRPRNNPLTLMELKRIRYAWEVYRGKLSKRKAKTRFLPINPEHAPASHIQTSILPYLPNFYASTITSLRQLQ